MQGHQKDPDFDLKEIQTLTFVSRQYFLYSSTINNPMPPELQSLYKSQDLIKQWTIFTPILFQIQDITSKYKQSLLVDLFDDIILHKIQDLEKYIDSFQGDDHELSTFVNSLFALPTILANHQKLHFERIYRMLLACCTKRDSISYLILNRLLILGQANLVYRHLDSVLNTIVQIAPNLSKIHSLVLVMIRQNDNRRLGLLLQKFSSKQLIELFRDHIVFSDHMKPSFAKMISSTVQQAEAKSMLPIVLVDWSTHQFMRLRSPNSQKFISNLLVLWLAYFKKQELQDIYLMECLNKGITNRFMNFSQYGYICQCGVIVWKKYAEILQLEDEITIKEFAHLEFFEDETQDDQISTAPEQGNKLSDKDTQKQTPDQIRTSVDSQAQRTAGHEEIEVEDDNILIRPKNLYDCYLGLLNESNIERKTISLKWTSQLVRTQCADLPLLWKNLTTVLLKMRDQNSFISNFESLKKDALVSLLIYMPAEVTVCISDYFYGTHTTTADKVYLMMVIKRAVTELADNPSKFESLKHQYHENLANEQPFYFKKVAAKYYNPSRERPTDHKNKQKIQQQSRRWGHTKRHHEEVLRSNSHLKTLQRADLIVVQPKDQDFFVNRLYLVIKQIFFGLVLKVRNSKLVNDVVFAVAFFEMLGVFSQNIKNYHDKYVIIDEILDLHKIITLKDISVERAKLNALLKVSAILDSALVSHQLLMNKMVSTCEAYRKAKPGYYDPTFNMIMDLVQQNVAKAIR